MANGLILNEEDFLKLEDADTPDTFATNTEVTDTGISPDIGIPGSVLSVSEFDALPDADTIVTPARPVDATQPTVDIASAFNRGLQNTITANIIEGIGRKTGFMQIPDSLPPAEESDTFTERAISFGSSLLDPVLFLFPFARIGKLATLGFAAKAGQRALATGALESAAKGAAQFGAFGATSEASEQFKEGKFDPKQAIKETLISAGTGAIINPAFGALGKAMKKAFKAGGAKTKRLLKDFEIKQRDPDKLANPQVVQRAKVLTGQISRLEQRIEQTRKLMHESPEKFNKDLGLVERSLDDINKLNKLNNKYQNVIEGPEFKAFKEAYGRFGNATFVENGRRLPVWKRAISPQNVILQPKEINRLRSIPDITKAQASIISPVDDVRIFQQADKSLRGLLTRNILEPIAQRATMTARSQKAFQLKLQRQTKRLLPDQSKERLSAIFRVMENRGTPKELGSMSPNEWQFINWSRKTYNQMVDELNWMYRARGLKLVEKRKDYVTHLQEMNFFNELGIQPNTLDRVVPKFAKKVKATFKFAQKRKSGNFVEDPILALQTYGNAAIKALHMQPVGSEALARIQYLPKNLRTRLTRWIEGPVFGGVDPKDKALLESGLQNVLTFAQGVSIPLTNAAILGNLKVAVQQPSQILATSVLSNIGYTLKGLKLAPQKIPPRLMKMSNFMSTRTVLDELPRTRVPIITKMQNFAGAVVNSADKFVARHSWYSGFMFARHNLHLSEPAAVRYADNVARMLHAGYKELYKPPLLRGKTGKAFFPFQSFVFNMWNTLTRDTRLLGELKGSSQAAEAAKLVGSLLATNQIYDMLGLPAPFGIVPSDVAKDVQAGAVPDIGEALQAVPIVGGARFGVPSPPLEFARTEFIGGALQQQHLRNKSILGNLWLIATSEDDEMRERAVNNLGKISARWLPIGTQVRNTITGIKAARDGYWSIGDEDIDLDSLDRKIAPLIGPQSTKAARRFFDKKRLERQGVETD